MNEDELRAFLESATTGETDDAESDDTEMDGTEIDGAETDRAEHSDNRIADEGANNTSGQQSANQPSFDELIGMDGAPAQTQADAPELTPIVLPGPPAARTPKQPVRQNPSPPVPPPTVSEPAPTQRIAQVPTQTASAPPLAPNNQRPTSQQPADQQPATSQLPAALGLAALAEAADAPRAQPTPASAVGGVDEEYEKIAVTGGEKKSTTKFMPWIVTGAGAVIVLIVAIIIVFSVRGDAEPEPTAAPTTEAPAPTTSAPAPEPSEAPEEPTEDPDTPPIVEVGPTGDIPIPQWNVTGQISAKFGWPQYTIDASNNLMFNGGTLLPQFPASCAEMRTGFGLTMVSEGEFEVFRPAETCAEAPELYDEVWGLTAAIIPTLVAS